MPTITDLFALPRPEWLDGSTLVPVLKGQVQAADREVYAESLYPLRFGWAPLRSLRADQYRTDRRTTAGVVRPSHGIRSSRRTSSVPGRRSRARCASGSALSMPARTTTQSHSHRLKCRRVSPHWATSLDRSTQGVPRTCATRRITSTSSTRSRRSRRRSPAHSTAGLRLRARQRRPLRFRWGRRRCHNWLNGCRRRRADGIARRPLSAIPGQPRPWQLEGLNPPARGARRAAAAVRQSPSRAA